MPTRQTMNVSLPPSQDQFVRKLVSAGRYRTASEVVRDGLRLLEEAEHRRLLEKWIYQGLSSDEEVRLPAELKKRARRHFQSLVDDGIRDIEAGRVVDGPTEMRRLKEKYRVGDP